MEPPRPPFARPGQSDPYLAALAERVLVYDGATGTNLQLAHLGPDDFGGAAFEGCNEILTVTRPDAIETLHRSFLDVGVDVIETDSFGSFSVVLAEYGIPERAHELGLASAQIARRVADEYTSPGSPKFVAGSIGPGTKFPTLGQITVGAHDPVISGDGTYVGFSSPQTFSSLDTNGSDDTFMRLLIGPPTVATVSPTALTAGTAPTITVTGSGFAANAVPVVDGEGVTVSAVSVDPAGTQITFTLTVAASGASGRHDLWIRNPGNSTMPYAGAVTGRTGLLRVT